MKKLLIGAAAAAAILSPAVASADTNAVVGLQYSNTDFGFDTIDSYGFNGAFSHDLDNGLFIQVDGAYSRSDLGGCCVANNYGAFHLGQRNDSYAFGGFASLGDLFAYSGIGVGIEGSLFWSNIVVNGSLGYQDFGDVGISLTQLAVDGSYFFTENLALNANISQTQGEDALDGDWTNYGIGGEWRTNGPTSFSLGYRTTDGDFEYDTWLLGVNFDFGTGSLRERASNGPSMNGARTLNNALDGFLP